MAYQYQGALARTRAADARWQALDFAAIPLQNLYRDYRKVYLTLTHPILNAAVYLDLDAVRGTLPTQALSMTVTQWLAGLGNASLPTITELPNLQERTAKFADAWLAGYKIEPVDRRRSAMAELPLMEKNDLLLTKPGVDFRQHWNSCMVTVNGMFHRIGGGVEGLFVVDGARSGRIANNNHVGLYSFREVGKLDYVSINSSMLYKSHPNQNFGNHINIKLPYDVSNKTVFLVLGGYLHAMDRCYQVTGPQSLRIDFNNYQWLQRYFDSRRLIDLSRLQLPVLDEGDNRVALADLYDEDVIRRYLTLSQSFLVILDTPNVYVRKHPLQDTGLIGRYIADTPLTRLPLLGQYGRVFEYHPSVQDGECVLACEPSVDDEFLFETAGYRRNPVVDDKRYSAAPARLSRAQLLEIGIFN